MFDERRVVNIVKRVMPAVVSIVVSEKLADFEKGLTPEMMAELPKSKDGRSLAIPAELLDTHGMIQVGGGSGFIVEEDGVIVTNKHVVSEAGEYAVVLDDGRTFKGEVLTRDPVNDIAILKIPTRDLPVILLGDSANLDLGEDVLSLGNALGIFKSTVSKGIISGLSRAITAQDDPRMPPQEMRGLIQTDAAINPGNSGGPLINMKGYAIGINAAIVAGAHSIGFAIPINTVKRDLHDLRKYGHIRRPLLGLRYLIIDGRMQERTNLPVDYGALIMGESPRDKGVVPNSPAAKAGVKERDIVLAINGLKVDREHTIQDFLENMNVGEVMHLDILRGEQEISLDVPLAERK